MHTKMKIRNFLGNSFDRMGWSGIIYFFTWRLKKTCSRIKFDKSVGKPEIRQKNIDKIVSDLFAFHCQKCSICFKTKIICWR